MPVFQTGHGLAPAWCELEFFEIVRLVGGESHDFDRVGAKEKLIVGAGSCRIASDGGDGEAVEPGADLNLTTAGGAFRVTDVVEAVTLIRMCGRWGQQLGGSGLFTAARADDPQDGGDPVDYPKQTSFDSHFHDCDEYWILFEGRGQVVTEGKSFDVRPGDCVATGMGHHHDMPVVHEMIRAVYFETTMAGLKRRGHLWNHKHGPAQPQLDRI